MSESTGTAVVRRKNTAATKLANVSAAAHMAPEKRSGQQVSEPTTAITNDEFFNKFFCSMNGVLYENPVLQIGIKSEFHLNIGM